MATLKDLNEFILKDLGKSIAVEVQKVLVEQGLEPGPTPDKLKEDIFQAAFNAAVPRITYAVFNTNELNINPDDIDDSKTVPDIGDVSGSILTSIEALLDGKADEDHSHGLI